MINIFEFFQYGFIVRGLLAGLLIAFIAPIVGIFLVLRRYSLISDTLAHISLVGIALGLLTGINPLITALLTSVIGSVGLEKVRSSAKLYGETALALFLSGSLAIAVILLGLSKNFSSSLLTYLFGSITTVSVQDLCIIFLVGLGVISFIALTFKSLVYISFDEESATVTGVPVKMLNALFLALAALTISLAIPIVGVLLISALIVIPVIAAMQFQKKMLTTLLIAQGMAFFSVFIGLVISFYANIAPGGTIVLLTITLFCISSLLRKKN